MILRPPFGRHYRRGPCEDKVGNTTSHNACANESDNQTMHSFISFFWWYWVARQKPTLGWNTLCYPQGVDSWIRVPAWQSPIPLDQSCEHMLEIEIIIRPPTVVTSYSAIRRGSQKTYGTTLRLFNSWAATLTATIHLPTNQNELDGHQNDLPIIPGS